MCFLHKNGGLRVIVWVIFGQNTISVEQALETLGRMLGFRTKRWPSQHGAPDGLWWRDDWAGFVFEAKFGATNPDVSIDDLRQAVSHPNFVRHEAWRIYDERGVNPRQVATLLRTRRVAALPIAAIAELRRRRPSARAWPRRGSPASTWWAASSSGRASLHELALDRGAGRRRRPGGWRRARAGEHHTDARGRHAWPLARRAAPPRRYRPRSSPGISSTRRTPPSVVSPRTLSSGTALGSGLIGENDADS